MELYVCNYRDFGDRDDFRQVDWQLFGQQLNNLAKLTVVTISLFQAATAQSPLRWTGELYRMVTRFLAGYVAVIGQLDLFSFRIFIQLTKSADPDNYHTLIVKRAASDGQD